MADGFAHLLAAIDIEKDEGAGSSDDDNGAATKVGGKRPADAPSRVVQQQEDGTRPCKSSSEAELRPAVETPGAGPAVGRIGADMPRALLRILQLSPEQKVHLNLIHERWLNGHWHTDRLDRTLHMCPTRPELANLLLAAVRCGHARECVGGDDYHNPTNVLYGLTDVGLASLAAPAPPTADIVVLMPKLDAVQHSVAKQVGPARSKKLKGMHADRCMDTPRRRLWQEIARKDIPKAQKSFQQSYKTTLRNAYVAAQACAKEIRKRTLESRKRAKETQLRSKKIMREMLTFWRKHDKEVRGAKNKIEKVKTMTKKQVAEIREVQWQQKKYNLLIVQVELYAHVMQNKGQSKAEFAKVQAGILNQATSSCTAAGLDESDKAVRTRLLSTACSAMKQHSAAAVKFNVLAQKHRAGSAREGDDGANHVQSNNGKSELDGGSIRLPGIFRGQLSSYQITGMRWLANLHDSGTTGILADETGLGKTVQTIATLAHIAEVQNEWGPFLVIAPASTLDHWVEELGKFVPDFRVLPYWGNERSILRREFGSKNLGFRGSQFHVVVTSYQFAVSDEEYFAGIPWQIMAFDKVQFISASEHWKKWLSFSCKNRIVLTSTPIQNTVSGLQTLLHTTMPTLFSGPSELEWFSKDIENQAANQAAALNSEQLSRLRQILKPVMLRRIQSDVAHELPKKVEVQVNCQLSFRQKHCYNVLKQQISVEELACASDLDKPLQTRLNNLLMQLRKVCNHPELTALSTARRSVLTPMVFEAPRWNPPRGALTYDAASTDGDRLDVRCTNRCAIQYDCPRLLFHEAVVHRQDHGSLGHIPWLARRMGIFAPDNLHRSLFPAELEDRGAVHHSSSAFSFSRLMGVSVDFVSTVANSGSIEQALVQQLALLHMVKRSPFLDPEEARPMLELGLTTRAASLTNEALIAATAHISKISKISTVRVIAAPIAAVVAGDAAPHRQQFQLGSFFNWELAVTAAYPLGFDHGPFMPAKRLVLRALEETGRTKAPLHPLAELLPLGHPNFGMPPSTSNGRVVFDSDKMRKLDKLLFKLKRNGHRVLLYSQMTTMLDLLEIFLTYRRYGYTRPNGPTKLSDRQDTAFGSQTRNDVFVFLLSTRAGGLGLNLTAADTVIFVDSDANPTVDQRAVDHTHRLGQKKPVTVYRLVTKGTVEELILLRARQNRKMQPVVMAEQTAMPGNEEDMKSSEVVSLLLDDVDVDVGGRAEQKQDKKRVADQAGSLEKATLEIERCQKRSKLQDAPKVDRQQMASPVTARSIPQ